MWAGKCLLGQSGRWLGGRDPRHTAAIVKEKGEARGGGQSKGGNCYSRGSSRILQSWPLAGSMAHILPSPGDRLAGVCAGWGPHTAFLATSRQAPRQALCSLTNFPHVEKGKDKLALRCRPLARPGPGCFIDVTSLHPPSQIMTPFLRKN